MAWKGDPQAHLELLQQDRQRRRQCVRCKMPIEGSAGIDRDGYYHPLPAGCP